MGEGWDADFVWDSAGKVTDDGYVVEIKLPLQSIRFSGGANVKMGILFWRRISRSGVSASWPDIPPGQWVFNRHAHLVFSELHPSRLKEVLPSITHSINQLRGIQEQRVRGGLGGALDQPVAHGLELHQGDRRQLLVGH